MKREILDFEDGALEIYTQGTPSESALTLHHGGLGSTLNMAPIFREAAARDIFVIGITRPGYAGSTSRPGRRAANYIEMTGHILDHFDISSFVSLGWSSGAPAALSDARDIRSKGAISISGDAPKGNLDWPDYEVKYPAKNSRPTLGSSLDLTIPLDHLRSVKAEELVRVFGDTLSISDAEIFNSPWGNELAAAMRDGLAPGDQGWIEDSESDLSNWEFDLGEIHSPVAIFQGDEDRMDIPGNGQYLSERIPNSELIILQGEGHISLIYRHSAQILDKALEFLDK